jgi:hypothetical protein
MKKNHLLVSRLGLIERKKHWLVIFFVCLNALACNNKKEENTQKMADTTSDHRAVTTTGQTDINDMATDAVKFYSYRIGIDTLKAHEARGYEKLIFTIRLDDLGNPSRMDLFYYEAMLAASGGKVGEYIYATTTTTDIVNLQTANLMVGNNELVLSDYKNPLTHTWLDFDYLIFSPVNNAGQLGFNVTAFKRALAGPDLPVNLPTASSRATKPSPPAKPAKVTSDHHVIPTVKDSVTNK